MLSDNQKLIYELLFFFKQKTAYEMRISDWSSDVCSSDLPAQDRRDRRLRHTSARGHQGEGRIGRMAGRHPCGCLTTDAAAPARDIASSRCAPLSMISVSPVTRSEGGRVGKEWVRTCRLRVTPYL